LQATGGTRGEKSVLGKGFDFWKPRFGLIPPASEAPVRPFASIIFRSNFNNYLIREVLLARKNIEGIKGWLLVYLIGSFPVLMFYSAGLSGVFGYPLNLLIVIFILLAIPLLLIILKSPKAPQWNIAMLWIAAILLTLRIIGGLLFHEEGLPPLSQERLLEAMPMLLGIEIFSLGWTIIWTKYFKKSVRVRNTFGKRH